MQGVGQVSVVGGGVAELGEESELVTLGPAERVASEPEPAQPRNAHPLDDLAAHLLFHFESRMLR